MKLKSFRLIFAQSEFQVLVQFEIGFYAEGVEN